MATGALNQRAVVQPQINKARTQVIASPVDTFVSPTTGNLSRLAQALSGLGQVAQPLIDLSEKKTQEEYLKAKQEKEMQDKVAQNWAARNKGMEDGAAGRAMQSTSNAAYNEGYVSSSVMTSESTLSAKLAAYREEHKADLDTNHRGHLDELINTELKGLPPVISLAIKASAEKQRDNYLAQWKKEAQDSLIDSINKNNQASIANNYVARKAGGISGDTFFQAMFNGERALVSQGAHADDARKATTAQITAQAEEHGDIGVLNEYLNRKDGRGLRVGDDPLTAAAVRKTMEAIERKEDSRDAAASKAANEAISKNVEDVTREAGMNPNATALDALDKADAAVDERRAYYSSSEYAKLKGDIQKQREKTIDYMERGRKVSANPYQAMHSADPKDVSAGKTEVNLRFNRIQVLMDSEGATPQQIEEGNKKLINEVGLAVASNTWVKDLGDGVDLKKVALLPTDSPTQYQTAVANLVANLAANPSTRHLLGGGEKEEGAWGAYAAALPKGRNAAIAAFNEYQLNGKAKKVSVTEEGWKQHFGWKDGKAPELAHGIVDALNSRVNDLVSRGTPPKDAEYQAFNATKHMFLTTSDNRVVYRVSPTINDPQKADESINNSGRQYLVKNAALFGIPADIARDATFNLTFPDADGMMTLAATSSDGQSLGSFPVSQEALRTAYEENLGIDNKQPADVYKDVTENGTKKVKLSDSPMAAQALYSRLADISAQNGTFSSKLGQAMEAIKVARSAGIDTSSFVSDAMVAAVPIIGNPIARKYLAGEIPLVANINALIEAVPSYYAQNLTNPNTTIFGNSNIDAEMLSGKTDVGRTVNGHTVSGAVLDVFGRTVGVPKDVIRDTTGVKLTVNPAQGTSRSFADEFTKRVMAQTGVEHMLTATKEGVSEKPYKDGFDKKTGQQHYSVGAGLNTSIGRSKLIEAAAFAGKKNPQEWADAVLAGDQKLGAVTPQEAASLYSWRRIEDSKVISKLVGGEEDFTAFKNKNPELYMLAMDVQYNYPALAKVMVPKLSRGGLKEALVVGKEFLGKNASKATQKNAIKRFSLDNEDGFLSYLSLWKSVVVAGAPVQFHTQ